MKKLKMILPVFALAIGGFVFATQASAANDKADKVSICHFEPDHIGEYVITDQESIDSCLTRGGEIISISSRALPGHGAPVVPAL